MDHCTCGHILLWEFVHNPDYEIGLSSYRYRKLYHCEGCQSYWMEQDVELIDVAENYYQDEYQEILFPWQLQEAYQPEILDMYDDIVAGKARVIVHKEWDKGYTPRKNPVPIVLSLFNEDAIIYAQSQPIIHRRRRKRKSPQHQLLELFTTI